MFKAKTGKQLLKEAMQRNSKPESGEGNALEEKSDTAPVKKSSKSIKKTGAFKGKSNKLGYGGRAAQMKARGVPGGVIGKYARRAGAAPGGPNYHGKRGKKRQ